VDPAAGVSLQLPGGSGPSFRAAAKTRSEARPADAGRARFFTLSPLPGAACGNPAHGLSITPDSRLTSVPHIEPGEPESGSPGSRYREVIMRGSSIRILAAIALGVSASDAIAQVEAVSFPTDEPVRVWRRSVPDVPLTGTVSSWTLDSLHLVQPPAPPATISLSDLVRLEVSRTKGHAATGALVGGGIGAALGLALGIATASDDFFDTDAGEVVAGTVLFAATGAGVGALIGLLVRTEEWEEVPLPSRAPAMHAE